MINQRYLIITPEEQQVLIEGHIEDEVLMLEAYKGGFDDKYRALVMLVMDNVFRKMREIELIDEKDFL